MKTSLFQLIFNIAFVRFPKITEYLGQYQLQRIRTNILHRTSIRVFHFTKPTVTDNRKLSQKHELNWQKHFHCDDEDVSHHLPYEVQK